MTAQRDNIQPLRRRKRLRVRYTLGGLLLLIALIGIGLTPLANEWAAARAERSVAGTILEGGGRVILKRPRFPWFPARVVGVALDGRKLHSSDITSVGEFERLTSLSLVGATLTKECVEKLRELDSVEFMYLNDTNMRDEDLLRLAGLRSIMAVHLSGTTISRDCAAQFACQSNACVHFEGGELILPQLPQ